MRFEPVHCGQFANESEKTAFDKVSQQIQQLDGEGLFIILTNLQFSLTEHRIPDDLDMVVIGPSGLQIVEVKHWDASFLKQRTADVEYRATKLNEKVRRLATRVRKDFPNLEFISGKFFLTKVSVVPEPLRTVVGLKFYGLDEWRPMLEIGAWGRWSEAQVRTVAKRISSAANVVLNPEISRIGPVSSLALVSDRSERFHRVFRGEHSEQRDRVVLHLYDLSATNEKNPLERARRACAVLQRYQKSASLPRLIDSFQELPEYPGVMYFFTHADDVAPSLAEVRSMTSWNFDQRLAFAIGALKALSELQDSDDGEPLLHRAITPTTLLVRADNRPLYAGWEWAKLPKSATISAVAPASHVGPFVAPEVMGEGLAVADKRSDVYSVCATLLTAFEGTDEEGALQASEILKSGLTADPEQRAPLDKLATLLEGIPRTQEITVEPPISRWSDNYEVKAFNAKYRVVSRLAGGAIGYAFKVVGIDLETGGDTETLVAKGTDERERGQQMLRAYKLARAHSGRPGLSGVAQVASDWQADKPVALLNWVDGESLDYWSGDVPLIAEDMGETDAEPLLLGWLSELCAGLGRLHAAGLIHGDVSPGNIIVNRAAVALTDYDLVTEIGKRAGGRGTPPYSSLRLRRGEVVVPRDDLYALAATFFYALTKRDPFMYDGVYHEERGLAWRPGEKESFPELSEFLDRALAGEFATAM
jgi:serine/threonine protein kinase